MRNNIIGIITLLLSAMSMYLLIGRNTHPATAQVSSMYMGDGLKIGANIITAFSTDTTAADWSTLNLITGNAAKRYIANQIATRQAALSGTGLVRMAGTTVSYDNSAYLAPSGTSGQYIRGNGTYATFPAIPRIDRYAGSTNASGVYSVTYSTAFAATPNVQYNIVGGSNKMTILLTSSTTTGFSVYVQLRSDVIGLLPTYSNVASQAVNVTATEQ